MKLNFPQLRPHRSLLLACLLALSCCALQAQTDTPPPAGPPSGEMRQRGPNPERQLEMLTNRLSLTSDQQTQVKSILADQRQKMEQLRNSSASADASGQAPPRREQMESIRNETDTKINALLNDNQKAKYAAMQQERKERMEHRGGPQGGPPPPPQGA